jgi:hypothetical protein
MTIGATSTFQESLNDICTDALTNLGVVAPGKDASQARTAGQLTHAARALNRLVKSMDADGELLWRVERRTITVSNFDLSPINVNSPGFSCAADVIAVDEPIRYTPATDLTGATGTIVQAMSRDDWMSLPDRDQTGTPLRYYVEYSSGSGGVPRNSLAIYFNPIPTANADIIEYSAYIKAADFVTGADTPDFLQKWTGCLVYGLTAELAAAYGQMDKLSAYRQMFLDEKMRLLADDSEHGRTFLCAFGWGTY